MPKPWYCSTCRSAPNRRAGISRVMRLPSLIHAKSSPGSTPQAPGHAIARDHALLHREMADSSRELVGPDVSAAVTFESYPRFIKGGFQNYESLGIKRSTADSKHVPSIRSGLRGNNVVWSLPQKVVEFLKRVPTFAPLQRRHQMIIK